MILLFCLVHAHQITTSNIVSKRKRQFDRFQEVIFDFYQSSFSKFG